MKWVGGRLRFIRVFVSIITVQDIHTVWDACYGKDGTYTLLGYSLSYPYIDVQPRAATIHSTAGYPQCKKHLGYFKTIAS